MSKSAEKTPRKVDNATKTVAAILQEFGRQAFDVADRSESVLQQMCDRWVAHLLLGEPSPSRQELAENWFDWPGVRDFMASERGRERTYVVKNINEYQDLALTLLRDFSSSVQTEHDADNELQGKLDELHSNAKTKSGDELRAEVFSTIAQVNEVLEQKRTRQEEQMSSLASQVDELKRELSQARETAQRDGLTKLYNRASFDKCVDECLGLRASEDTPAVLLLCDIDHFKSLNDNHGHQFGDEVIVGVAQTMMNQFERENDFVARYGGEEFAIIHRGSSTEARLRATQLLDAIRESEFIKAGKRHPVTISIGIAALRGGETAESWIERSDKALYTSKRMGRNRLTIDGS